MPEQHNLDRVWKLMSDVGFCMLATREGEDIRSRPMAAYLDREDNAVYFLTDATHHKSDEIAKNPNVGLIFANTDGQTYISVTGRAEISNDRAKIRELWSTPAKAWWDSPDDPSLRLLTVVPKDAEFWDSPGTMVSYVKMMAAAMSNSRPDMGDNVKVEM